MAPERTRLPWSVCIARRMLENPMFDAVAQGDCELILLPFHLTYAYAGPVRAVMRSDLTRLSQNCVPSDPERTP